MRSTAFIRRAVGQGRIVVGRTAKRTRATAFYFATVARAFVRIRTAYRRGGGVGGTGVSVSIQTVNGTNNGSIFPARQ